MIIITEEDKKRIKEEIKTKTISYSQMSNFLSCPLKYKLKYIDKIDLDKPSIHLLFGSAFHSTLQTYIQTCYTKSAKLAGELKFEDILFENIQSEFKSIKEKHNTTSFTNPTELKEFYYQGLEIIQNIVDERTVLFPIKNHELIGIEIPICYKIDGYDITLIGYIDYGIKDIRDNTHYLNDIKTSYNGWYSDQRKDEIKLLQLLLYKRFYSEQYNVPLDNIKPEFLVVKRKQYTGVQKSEMFPNQLKKYQQISVTSGTVKLNKAKKQLDSFLQIFNTDGTYNTNFIFNSCKSEHNCKWCTYNGTEYCKE